MSVVRNFALAALFAFSLPLGAQAQSAPPPAGAAVPAPAHHGRHHGKSMIHALKHVNLNAAQKQQIGAFRSQERQANLNADPATKRANAAKMRQQIRGVLTPAQNAQLSSQMHHRQPASGTVSQPQPPPAPGSAPGTPPGNR